MLLRVQAVLTKSFSEIGLMKVLLSFSIQRASERKAKSLRNGKRSYHHVNSKPDEFFKSIIGQVLQPAVYGCQQRARIFICYQ